MKANYFNKFYRIQKKENIIVEIQELSYFLKSPVKSGQSCGLKMGCSTWAENYLGKASR